MIGPVWEASARAPRFGRLGGDLAVDVAVVGGGITGLTAAWLLRQAGRSVAVLELLEPGAGATGRSSGHLTAVLDRRFAALREDFGEEGAARAVRWSREAVDFIERTVQQLGAPSCFERVPGYLFAERGGEELLRREAELAVRFGLSAEFTRRVPLPFPTSCGVRIDGQAQIDPRAYLEALASAVDAAGGLIFGHTRVERIDDGKPIRLHAPPHVVTAANVVEATHTPINLSLEIQSRVLPVTSYMMAFRAPGPPLRGIYWDTESPYHYLRGAGELLLVGGEDQPTGGDIDPDRMLDVLKGYARRRFGVAEAVRAWSQQVFEPADGLPYIGRKPGSAGIYEAGGFAGNGLTFGTAAAQLLSRMILGEEVPGAELLSPGRIKPIASARRFLQENLSVAWHLIVDRLRRDEAAGLPSLQPGEGRLVEVDGHAAAVYRDESGDLHLLSPTCTHAGCIVRWNGVERTWDCPCHGGRFDPKGRVLCSPPTRDLAPLPEPAVPSPRPVGPPTP